MQTEAAPSSLKSYYFLRAGIAAAWVALAFTVGRSVPQVAAILLVAYPAWDALANFLDAQKNGGLAANRSQAVNVAVSSVTSVAVLAGLFVSMNAVLGVWGAWAVLAGVLQLVTGLRRWTSYGAQWTMILSGGQSALAGLFFVKTATAGGLVSIVDVAPYAAFGAFYFLVSALWLTVSERRRGVTSPAT